MARLDFEKKKKKKKLADAKKRVKKYACLLSIAWQNVEKKKIWLFFTISNLATLVREVHVLYPMYSTYLSAR